MKREDADANGLCRHLSDWREHCDGCEDDLRAEIARLREALEEIADMGRQAAESEAAATARIALGK